MRDTLLNNETAQSAIKALLYFDIFHYPITASEVYHFLETNHTTKEEVTSLLKKLSKSEVIYQHDEFYSLENKFSLIERRKKGNQEAERWMPLALRRARFIQSFPFVRAVFASGSLSKNYMDNDSDLDFFVVTKPGRLWIARMLLILYKRTFLLNSHKTFCVNYLVDEDHLEIEEKNIFTATELATLRPLTAAAPVESFFEANAWIKNFFPNFGSPMTSYEIIPQGLIKTVFEKTLSLIGSPLDTLFMRLTYKRWQKLYSTSHEPADFNIAFKTKKFASKNHPQFFQKKVITLYNERLKSFSSKFKFQWIHE